MQVLQLQAGKAPVYVYMHARTERACTCQARTMRNYAGGQDPGAMMWPYMCVHIYTGHAPTCNEDASKAQVYVYTRIHVHATHLCTISKQNPGPLL
jgi:hypothetical protein